MKIEIEKSYPLKCAPQVAWQFLNNLEAVAGCMPGAKITERLDPTRYRGTVTARIGPATMSFRGEVEMKDVDPVARSLRLIGKGTDSTGSSGASLDLAARIDSAASATECALVGKSEMSVSGKAATFGGRMMNAVADQILAQFGGNVAAQVSALHVQQEVGSGGEPAPAAGSTVPAASSASTPPASAAPARELNVLALAWAVLVSWVRRLFSRSAA
jgi:carbon monoxide dehydrogenase subunit G